MRRFLIAVSLAAPAFAAFACSGYGTSQGGPNGPSGPPPAGAIVIDIVGVNGAQSFAPNPATVPAGQTVVWRNTDTIPHRVVLNDRKLDTGNIGPGAFSEPMTLVAPGPYHCSIHPPMVGSITGGQ
jgi:plastocyanin